MNEEDLERAPPKAFRFLPGISGNPRGKPKGAINRKKLIRKVALKKHPSVVDGARTRTSLLDLVVLKLKAMAMEGSPGAATLVDWLREQVTPGEGESTGGFLVVPEPRRSLEEEKEAMERYNRDLPPFEPGSDELEEWYRAQAAKAKPRKAIEPDSLLAQAIEEFKIKWGHSLSWDDLDPEQVKNL